MTLIAFYSIPINYIFFTPGLHNKSSLSDVHRYISYSRNDYTLRTIAVLNLHSSDILTIKITSQIILLLVYSISAAAMLEVSQYITEKQLKRNGHK
jgi:hypothetical protein